MKPVELSMQLRNSKGNFLEQRRVIAGLSLTAIASMGLISLYQLGIIKHLPEPPLRYLAADKVDASEEAYSHLQTPDGILGLGSYTITLALAGVGGANRAREQPWLPLALLVKIGIDTLMAGKLTADQWTKHRAFCTWCLVASFATFTTIPFVLPEAWEALYHVKESLKVRKL